MTAQVPTERPVKPVRWMHALGLMAPLLVLALLAAYSVIQSRRADSARESVAATLRVHEMTLELAQSITAMELHQRGFLLTGDPTVLARRDAAFTEGAWRAGSLIEATQRHPDSMALVRRLRTALSRRYGYMRAMSDVATREGLEAARRGFQRHGSGSADGIMQTLRSLRTQQRATLQSSIRDADRQARRFRIVLIFGTVASLALLALTVSMLYRQLRRTQRLGLQLERAHREQASKALELERSNRELEAFSYTISHDLRAPLRHIGGYAQMLQEDAADQLTPDMRRYLDAITDSSRRMGALIDDLLAFSRLGRKPIERSAVDMSRLIEQVLHELRMDGIATTVDVGALPPASADPMLMRQVWLNLLSNAMKYSRNRGADATVQVTGERDERKVRYRVRDNGVGFDMRYADKLFGVFQRLHTDEEFEGTGVGLAIVQQIVHRHGGHIRADAMPGQGACFTFELPVEIE